MRVFQIPVPADITGASPTYLRFEGIVRIPDLERMVRPNIMDGLLCDISSYRVSNVGCLIHGTVDVGVGGLNFDHAETKRSQDLTHFSILLQEFAHVRKEEEVYPFFCLSFKQVTVCLFQPHQVVT